jgi:hypothetical protein
MGQGFAGVKIFYMVEPMEKDHAAKRMTKYGKVLHPPYHSPQYFFIPEFRSPQLFQKRIFLFSTPVTSDP